MSTKTSVPASIPNEPTEEKAVFNVCVVGSACAFPCGMSIFHTRALPGCVATVSRQGKLPTLESLKQLLVGTSDAYSEIGVVDRPVPYKVEVIVLARIVWVAVKVGDASEPPRSRLASPGWAALSPP